MYKSDPWIASDVITLHPSISVVPLIESIFAQQQHRGVAKMRTNLCLGRTDAIHDSEAEDRNKASHDRG